MHHNTAHYSFDPFANVATVELSPLATPELESSFWAAAASESGLPYRPRAESPESWARRYLRSIAARASPVLLVELPGVH